jgi:hypothetical protein
MTASASKLDLKNTEQEPVGPTKENGGVKIMKYSLKLTEEEKNGEYYSPILLAAIQGIFCTCRETSYRQYRDVKQLTGRPATVCVFCATQRSRVSLVNMDETGHFRNPNNHDPNNLTFSIGNFVPAIPNDYGGYHLSYTAPAEKMELWESKLVIRKFKVLFLDWTEGVPYQPIL